MIHSHRCKIVSRDAFLSKTIRSFHLHLWCSITLARQIPTVVTVDYLAQNPQKLDGQLVRVRAQLKWGWEGDNFLYDSPDAVLTGKASSPPPRMWLYCDPPYEQQVCGALKNGPWRVIGTFTGYYHYAPNKKSRANHLFDPGPLQLSAVAVSDVHTELR